MLGTPALGWPVGKLDEMILVVLPERVLHGELPYRDFSTVYGPAHWYLLSAVQWLAGPSVLAERIFGVGVHLVLVLGLYRLTRHDGLAASAVSGLTAALLLFPLGDAAYAWVTMSAFGVWQLALLRPTEPSRLSVAFAGTCAALAVGCRPDAALLVLVPAAILLRTPTRFRSWLAGGAIGSVPLLVAAATAPSELVHDIVGRALHGAGQSRLDLPLHDAAQAALLCSLLLGVLLSTWCAALARDRFVLAIAASGILALPQAFQRAETVHFLFAGLLVLPLAPQVLGRLAARFRFTTTRPRELGVILCLPLLLAAMSGAVVHPLLASALGQGPDATKVTHGGRTVPVIPSQADALVALLAAVDVRNPQGRSLFVFDENLARPALTDATVYFLLPETQQHAYNVELSPGLSNAPGSRLEQDLDRADLLVLLTPTDAGRRANYPYEKDGPLLPMERLRRDFCKTQQVAFYAIYERCRPRPAGYSH